MLEEKFLPEDIEGANKLVDTIEDLLKEVDMHVHRGNLAAAQIATEEMTDSIKSLCTLRKAKKAKYKYAALI
ncbi:hypothetical protein ACIQ4I_05670 [Rummeliibacillus sp. NPDC094406]|uniref:hypothetical protein n=1 Tax=Rummeliibacillus sp. NPDC094406 TaxID=3364511 RepID=UPI003824B01F